MKVETGRAGSDHPRDPLELALFGTAQQLLTVMESQRWENDRDRAELLRDLRRRLEETGSIIERWLESTGRDS